jgi:hypothetical protein
LLSITLLVHVAVPATLKSPPPLVAVLVSTMLSDIVSELPLRIPPPSPAAVFVVIVAWMTVIAPVPPRPPALPVVAWLFPRRLVSSVTGPKLQMAPQSRVAVELLTPDRSSDSVPPAAL